MMVMKELVKQNAEYIQQLLKDFARATVALSLYINN